MKMLKHISGYLYTQLQTTIHKFWVFYYAVKFCVKDKGTKRKITLLISALFHDNSKYSWIEAKGFATTIFDLKHSTYGSEEYKALLDKIQPSLKHHYNKNAHHPEFLINYYKDLEEKERDIDYFDEMIAIEKIEMVVDWRSATRRHKDGDIFESIEINQKRFGYSDEDKEYFITIAKLIV